MNHNDNRWWIAGVLGLILGLAIALSTAQTPFAEGGAWLVGLVGLGVLLIALLLVVAAIWPGFGRRAQAGLERSPGKTFLIGLVNYAFLGAIALFPYNFEPRGWIWAEGQLLQIASNTALFSLLGTIYGGDGRTTFRLPDMRGLEPVCEQHWAIALVGIYPSRN